MELRGFFAVSISKKGQFIQPHATSVLSWDFIILGSQFCEISFTDGACRQCFIQSLQLKKKHFSFYQPAQQALGSSGRKRERARARETRQQIQSSKSVTIEILSHLDFKTKTRELDLSVLLIDRYNYSECFLCKILIINYFYVLVYLSYLSTSADRAPVFFFLCPLLPSACYAGYLFICSRTSENAKVQAWSLRVDFPCRVVFPCECM